MGQPIEEIETWYEKEDPWDYKTTKDDQDRKERIIKALGKFSPIESILDIGCGEGWITKDLPGKLLYGFDVSQNASKRLPENVKYLEKPIECDVVCFMGILYPHYDGDRIWRAYRPYARKYLFVSGIEGWLVDTGGVLLYEEKFPYREYTQVIRIYATDPQHWSDKAQ